MELKLKRIAKQKWYTIGRLCDTLEPTWRDIGPGGKEYKIKGKTPIPEGRYPVVITYSPRFKEWLPLLVGVPGFSGIRIHAGNTPQGTPRAAYCPERTSRKVRCSTHADGYAASSSSL